MTCTQAAATDRPASYGVKYRVVFEASLRKIAGEGAAHQFDEAMK
jgi:hypothetical protein